MHLSQPIVAPDSRLWTQGLASAKKARVCISSRNSYISPYEHGLDECLPPAGRRYLYMFSGARPSPGAAMAENGGCPEWFERLIATQVAAPEDGRVPLKTYRYFVTM